MKANQYLQQVKWLDNTVNEKLEQIDRLKDLAEKTTAGYPETERVQTSPDNQKLADIVAKIVDLESELNKDIEKLVEVEADVRYRIEQVENDKYKILLTLKYLNFKTWPQISKDMRLDIRWLHRLHERALEEFDETKIEH